jgi:hypothetical protein
MLTNYRSDAAIGGTPRLALVATGAVLATLAALVFFLLHPMGSDAAGAKGPVVSTASTSLGRGAPSTSSAGTAVARALAPESAQASGHR